MLATGLWLLPGPLGSSRPKSDGVEFDSVGDQDVQARLWADPFRAVSDYGREYPTTMPADGSSGEFKSSQPHTIDDLRVTMQQFIKPDKRLLILPVLVRGAAYAEDAEVRLRTRYALLAALNNSGYVPHDSEHLGFITEPWLTDRQVESDPVPDVGSTNLEIPYEWLTHDDAYPPAAAVAESNNANPQSITGARATHILVLWLDDTQLMHRPLVRLSRFLKRLIHSPIERQSVQVRVLGPSNSELLREMLRDPLHSKTASQFETDEPTYQGSKLDDPLDNFEILSYRASAALDALSCGARSQLNPQTTFADPCGYQAPFLSSAPASAPQPTTASTNPPIYRTTVTDDEIAKAMFNELVNRGLEFKDASTRPHHISQADHIAIVSEWDTFYGRALPITFDAVLRSRNAGNQNPTALLHFINESVHDAEAFDTPYEKSLDQNVFYFSYLRGVDGAAPGQATGTGSSSAGTGGESKGTAAGNSDNGSAGDTVSKLLRPADPSAPPAGTIQFDYARRMADEIVKLDTTLRDNGRHGIGAVGILGSDVYDKLLLLQALRNQLPRAYFFTTELDNRLLDPTQLPYTQGVLVGSAFGLRLADRYQHDIPPFRDANQTCLFLTGMLATGAIRASDFPSNPAAHIFEIGRNGAIELSDLDAAPEFPLRSADDKPGTSGSWLNPPRHTFDGREFWSDLVVDLAVITLVGVALFLVFSGRFFGLLVDIVDFLREPKKNSIWENEGFWMFAWTILAAGTFIWLFLVAYHQNLDSSGEPFALISGISIWPAEFLRIFAFILTVYFLIHARFVLSANEANIVKEYDLTAPAGNAWSAPPKRRSKIEKVLVKLWRFIASAASILVWGREERPARYPADETWARYCQLALLRHRFSRVFLPSVCIFMFLCVLFGVFGRPISLCRGGPYMARLDVACGLLEYVAVIVINCVVIDASRLCKMLAEKLRGEKCIWPDPICLARAKSKGAHPKDIGFWLDVQLIAARSEPIVKLIYAPFIVLTLMILSRLTMFDRMGYPPPVIFTYVALASCSVAAALMLRNAAELTRKEALKKLREHRTRLLGKAAPRAVERLQQLDALIAEVEKEDRGAFAPFSQQPVVAALLLQTGGVGVWTVLEHFSAFTGN